MPNVRVKSSIEVTNVIRLPKESKLMASQHMDYSICPSMTHVDLVLLLLGYAMGQRAQKPGIRPLRDSPCGKSKASTEEVMIQDRDDAREY